MLLSLQLQTGGGGGAVTSDVFLVAVRDASRFPMEDKFWRTFSQVCPALFCVTHSHFPQLFPSLLWEQFADILVSSPALTSGAVEEHYHQQ